LRRKIESNSKYSGFFFKFLHGIFKIKQLLDGHVLKLPNPNKGFFWGKKGSKVFEWSWFLAWANTTSQSFYWRVCIKSFVSFFGG
jgi:hypothetical protein